MLADSTMARIHLTSYHQEKRTLTLSVEHSEEAQRDVCTLLPTPQLQSRTDTVLRGWEAAALNLLFPTQTT